MKTIEFTLSNAETVFTRKIEINKDGRKGLDQKVAFGTVMQDFFDLVDLQKQGSVKLFKFSQPFDVQIKYDRTVIDTAKIGSELKTKFKLNSSPKRKRNFAKNVYAVLSFASKDIKAISVDVLASKLEAEIAEMK